jgi:hypothetical protein
MPWCGPTELRTFPTLGYDVAKWIQAHCVIPDGDHQGERYKLTPEMVRFLLHHYRVDPITGAFAYRRSQLVRPQKWGKGPFSAAMICAEAAGPVLFDGWDAAGEPVGRPWQTPLIQVTAVSEDQAQNVWAALVPMIELGNFDAEITDTGLTRINLPNGGRIEPVTASARSRLGQRLTFAVQDETHSWFKHDGGWRLADNQRRNAAGMGGRLIETTNAWDPAEESVAQQTAEYGGSDVYRDHLQPPANLSIRNKRERKKALRHVYGDSWWVPIDRIDAEVEELAQRDAPQAERFFLNRIVADTDAWLAPAQWAECAAPAEVVADREAVTLGFDGSLFDDHTALIGCRISDGHLFELAVWAPPDGGQINQTEVDAAVDAAFARFDVVRMYADPPYWQDYVGKWHADYGDAVREWWTNRERAMIAALERLHTAVTSHQVTHDGSTTLAQHVGNARRQRVRSGVTVRKDRPGSSRKIDAAIAATLAYEARADVIAAGAPADYFTPFRIR